MTAKFDIGSDMNLEEFDREYRSGRKNFSWINLTGLDLSGYDLTGLDFTGAGLLRVTLPRNLKNVRMTWSYRGEVDLSRSDHTQVVWV